MNVTAERSYPTLMSNLMLLPLLLTSLARQRHTPHASTKIKDEYDYIVVGAGAAGSVVASRLSEEPCVNVLLLEAGGEPPLLTEVPGYGTFFWGTDVSYHFLTAPQKYTARGLVNRQINWMGGKMLGGSSNLNLMIYVRGNRRNYDDWSKQGAKGWSYREVFPYFVKLEDNTDPRYLANGYHGSGGPITVESSGYHSELKSALSSAVSELKYKFVDPNAATQTGFYDLQRNVRDGQRCSSLKGYLVPAENRTNLDILINAMVTKVIIEDGQATGVEFYCGGQTSVIKARREVIVSAGTVNTPKILMLSGVGPKEELQKFNIPVIADLPVGKNFHDQGGTIYPFTVKPSIRGFYEEVLDPSSVFQYIGSRTGPLATTTSLLSSFLKGSNCDSNIESAHDVPDYQMSFEGLTILQVKHNRLKPEVYKQFYGPYEDQTFFGCVIQQLHPKSRGTVTLLSRNPFDPPVIDPNHLEDPRDLEDVVDGLKMCKKMLNTTSLLAIGAKPFETLIPGCELFANIEDKYFRCWARTILYSFLHCVGTCKMGDPMDPTTVVDPELRVKNIKGLRVVDASIMPTVTSGNIHIPTVMIGEKASDMIKESICC